MSMRDRILALRENDVERSFGYIAGAPVIYHCNHFNLFLDQTVADAAGPVIGWRIRYTAAEQSAYQVLCSLRDQLGVESFDERIELATTLFSMLGHGTLQLELRPDGGTARGQYLHYSFAWKQKYGSRVRCRNPQDPFAAGYIAATAAMVYGVKPGTYDTKEVSCAAMHEVECVFSITRVAGGEVFELPERARIDELTHAVSAGVYDEQIDAISSGLRDFLTGVHADENGVIEGFGVLITQHLAGYYNALTYNTMAHVREHMPMAIPAMESLLRESAHVCVFYTFGGIMASPEWDALVGRPQGTMGDVVYSCVAIARALGFGRWSLHAFEPDKRLVLRAPQTYESAYHRLLGGGESGQADYFIQGAAVAMMRLSSNVDWHETEISFDEARYTELFRAGKSPWKVTQRSCVSNGGACVEVCVEKA